MTPTDKTRLLALVGNTLTFYGRPVNEFALSVWTAACEPFTYAEVAGALTKHATDPERGAFCPMPADVVRQLAGTRGDRSLLAWNEAIEAVRRLGSWQSVSFDDKLIHAVIADMGGWQRFCALQIDDMPFDQRRFSELYKAYATAPDCVHKPTAMIGGHGLDPVQVGGKAIDPKRLN